MSQKLNAALGLLVLFILPTLGAADDTGTQRVTSVATIQANGATTTNAISYNARGLPSRYDISGSGFTGMSATVNLTYNGDDQIIRMDSTSKSLFGTQTEVAVYTYDVIGDRRLKSIQTTVSNGYTFMKQFTYAADGRVTGMNLEGDGPDGPIVSAHTVTYDSFGRVLRSEHTYSTNGIEDGGYYDVSYDKDGNIATHINKQPLNAETSAIYSYTSQTLTVAETTAPIDGNAGLSTQKVSTFAPGPCRVPKITDGFTVEQIFNGPPGFFSELACRP